MSRSPLYWLALLPPPTEPAQTLAWWALQFTPRVALLEEAAVLELGASLRLFGGARALHRRLLVEGRPLGLARLAWAPTSLGALALARAGQREAISKPLAAVLDTLPLHCLSAVQEQAPMLERLGCRRLADVRRLPRAALARRFGAELLLALDRAYGEIAEAHAWISAPEQFDARLELPYRVEHSQALGHYAEALLRQFCAWLAARHAGVRQLTLAWEHDAMRARDAGSGGALTLHTADTTRDFRHLARLMAEHLAKTELAAPAGELRLSATEILPLATPTAALLPELRTQSSESLNALLERLAVRLGPERVCRAQLREDHRPEQMQSWAPWGVSVDDAMTRPPSPQPSWLLDPPLPLSSQRDQPRYQGPLQKLAGPQRVEGGWWSGGNVQRDYYLMRSERAGLLWVYAERLSEAEQRWFLQGVFG
ncbi:MAG TPA: DNA polymerase Y family protein [Burkholderiaceae bacterium]